MSYLQKFYQLPIINGVLELVFCLIYYVLLTLFNLSGGFLQINLDGYAIWYKNQALGKIAYAQVFTFYTMSHIFFVALINIYKIKIDYLVIKIKDLTRR